MVRGTRALRFGVRAYCGSGYAGGIVVGVRGYCGPGYAGIVVRGTRALWSGVRGY